MRFLSTSGRALVLVALLVSACTRSKPEPMGAAVQTGFAQPPAATSPLPTNTALGVLSTEVPPLTPTPRASEAAGCELVAEGNIKAYRRPGLQGGRYSTLEPGLRVAVEAVSEDGWIGFDPGVVQSGTVGIFRLRWVRNDGALHLEGSCITLPVVEGPPAGVCFAAAAVETAVYAAPDLSSSLIVNLEQGGYAQALGLWEGWVYVDLSVGSARREARGWMPMERSVLDGPCQELPTVTP